MRKLFIHIGNLLLNPNEISAIIVTPIDGTTHRTVSVVGAVTVVGGPEEPEFELTEHTYRKLTGAIQDRYNVLTIHASGRAEEDNRGEKLTVLKLVYPDQTVFVFPSKLFAVSSAGRMLRFHIENLEDELPAIYCSEDLKELEAFSDFLVLEDRAA